MFSESIDEVIEMHGLQRTSLLREFAIKTGIQVGYLSYKILLVDAKPVSSVKITSEVATDFSFLEIGDEKDFIHS